MRSIRFTSHRLSIHQDCSDLFTILVTPCCCLRLSVFAQMRLADLATAWLRDDTHETLVSTMPYWEHCPHLRCIIWACHQVPQQDVWRRKCLAAIGTLWSMFQLPCGHDVCHAYEGPREFSKERLLVWLRKWVESMFRTWYSMSQIYTTVVIIIAGPGMDLYFVLASASACCHAEKGCKTHASVRWGDDPPIPTLLCVDDVCA